MASQDTTAIAESRRLPDDHCDNKTLLSQKYFHYKSFQIVKRNNVRVRLSAGSRCSTDVFLAISKLDNKEYALKVIEKRKVDIAKTRRDLDFHLTLKHPNLIKLHSYSETKQKFFVILEKASNSLKSEVKLKKRSLTDQECKKYIEDILNAVEYLHELGLCGFEINLDHILITDDFKIKLCYIKHSDEAQKFTGESKLNDLRAIGINLYFCIKGSYQAFVSSLINNI